MQTLQSVPGPVLLVGAGKMGGALLEGWLSRGLPPALVAVRDPSTSVELAKLLSSKRITRDPPPPLLSNYSAVVLAVKPQEAGHVLADIARFVGKDTVVISVMAGRPLSFLTRNLPKGAAALRAMPNTPASVGRGITVAVPNNKVTQAHQALAQALLSATGPVEWIKNEKLMDAVTAVSGSGPAYVFLLVESLARAGIAAGLPKPLAEKLARETVSGAGELMRRSELEPAKLRENVTSKGGTTEAALKILMSKSGFDGILKKAVAAATKRSKELGK